METPVFLLAIHQKLVKQEENPLLDVSSRNLQEDALHEHLCACVGDVGALQRDRRSETDARTWTAFFISFPLTHSFSVHTQSEQEEGLQSPAFPVPSLRGL